MTDPIDIIANAMRVADGNHTMGTGQLAEVAANALADDQIIANAAEELVTACWTARRDNARAMAEIVLRSVAGTNGGE